MQISFLLTNHTAPFAVKLESMYIPGPLCLTSIPLRMFLLKLPPCELAQIRG